MKAVKMFIWKNKKVYFKKIYVKYLEKKAVCIASS